jgi:class 3 adenylate cyclase
MDDSLLAATVVGSICAGLGVVLLLARLRKDGPTIVVQPEGDVTVVACSLRGFAAYAEAVPSKAVHDLLAEYHAAVGCAAAEVGGSVDDCSADGMLVLLGAPLPRGDHASTGLTLARRIHEVTGPVIERWATGPHPLAIGVGVATGLVASAARVVELVHDGDGRAYGGSTPPFSGRF